uniref:Uncharacterized protein n=1 Tax=Pseudonaja textilis TaxID=8673 RepID=A0A670Y108_PSETE
MLSSVGFCLLNLLHIIADFLRKFWVDWARWVLAPSGRSIYFKMASYLNGTPLNNPLYVLCFQGLITSEYELFLQLCILDPPLTFWPLFTLDCCLIYSPYTCLPDVYIELLDTVTCHSKFFS